MNRKLLKASAIGYVACMPLLTLSEVFVMVGMFFGIMMTMFITIEFNKRV